MAIGMKISRPKYKPAMMVALTRTGETSAVFGVSAAAIRVGDGASRGGSSVFVAMPPPEPYAHARTGCAPTDANEERHGPAKRSLADRAGFTEP